MVREAGCGRVGFDKVALVQQERSGSRRMSSAQAPALVHHDGGRPAAACWLSKGEHVALRTVIRRRRSLLLAALALLAAVVVPGADASLPGKPAGPVGCDAGRLAGTHHPGDTRSHPANVAGCVSYTHAGYGESWLIVTPPIVSNGTTVPSAVIRGGPYQDHPTTQLPSFGIARSVDEGAHWANLQFAGNSTEVANRCGSDPGFYRDPVTNRTFWYGDGSCEDVSYVVGPMNIMYSDDGGESWRDFADPMNFFPDIFDAAHMLGAPATTADSKAALARNHYAGNVIYMCGGSTCYKSVDGGVTYGNKSSIKALAAGQKDGKLYTLSSGVLNVSTDEGKTWSPQGKAIPSSLSAGGIGMCTRAGGAGDLWVDNANNIYVGGTSGGKLAVAYSRDGGNSWSSPITAQMPEVTSFAMCSFAADPDRPGHIAFAYNGATAKTPSPTQHGYLTETENLFEANPLFTSVQVDSDSDPLLPNGGPAAAAPGTIGLGGAGMPPHSVSRYDYMGVTFSPVDGRPWASYAKDRCNLTFCLDQPDPNLTSGDNMQRNYFWTGWIGAVGTMATIPTA